MLRNDWIQGLKKAGAVVLMGAMLTACGSGADDKALAVYKNAAEADKQQTVSQEQFDTFISVNRFLNPQIAYYEQVPAFKEDMLKQYIGFNILGSRLDADAKKEASDQAKEEFASFKEMMGEQLTTELKNQELELSDLEDYVHLYSNASVYLEGKIAESDLQKEYDDALAEDPNAFTTATVSHILIGTVDPMTQQEKRSKEEALKIANTARDELLGGADFAAMVEKYSEDEGSKPTGGTYADANVNGWVEGFKKAALELPLNEISEPVETEYGYHIIKVSDRKVPTYEDMKENLQSQVVVTKFTEFMDNELPDLIVETNLPKEEAAEGNASEEQDEKNTDEAPATDK